MRTVVITGSTRGIGFGLANSLLARGCCVMVSGRTEAGVERAIEALSQSHCDARIHGCPCDVRDPRQVAVLWDKAKADLGQVDVWINNAGVSNPEQMIHEIPREQVKEVVDTNLLGVIYGSQVAVRGMLAQGHGSIYNMEGMGSDGRMHVGLIPYGMTKYGVGYFTRGLIKETASTPLIVASLRPGMVITDLITGQFEGRPEEWKQAKRIFNIIADRVETVAPWLVDRILENETHGARIAWMTRRKLIARFLTARLRRRDLFGDEELT